MAKIDHAGLLTESYEDAQRFFEEVFGMRKWREDGEKPARRCWYMEGIQLNETAEKIDTEAQNGYGHISIAVESVSETMEKLTGYPVKVMNDHWFQLPNGTKIERKPLDKWKVNS